MKSIVAAAAITVTSIIVTPNAYAATTVLNTGTSWFDNFNLTSGQYFAFAVDVDSAFTVESLGFMIGTGKTSADLTGSTVTFYTGHPSSPTNSSNLLGTLTFSSVASEASRLRVTYTGSVSIPSAGRYWWKISNLASGKDIWVLMGGYSGHTGTWTAWNGTANWDLNGTINNSVGEYPKVLISGTSGGGGGGNSSDPDADRKEALRKRQIEIDNCKASLKAALVSNQTVEAGTFAKCGYRPLSIPSEITVINTLQSLPIDSRTADNVLTAVVTKVGVYEDLQGDRASQITPKLLIQTGIIKAEVPNKTVITLQLQNLDINQRDTAAEIDAFVAAESKKMVERKARLLATISKIQGR